MKLLSVVIPCYNSQDYMRYCIESLLPGGERVELLIVNDGSADRTGQIADEYASRYPGIVKAIHQENGGHGEAVNAGIRHAAGLYFKVVDSDDWVDVRAYLKILETLSALTGEDKHVDMLVSNFVYEKEGKKYRKIMKYDDVLPEGRIFTWDDIQCFRKGQYMLMHSVMYRTQLLRDCRLELPQHTFYVDNLFVYTPLAHVKTLYYVNVDFYRYFIGREGQSVQESVMIRRIDQQIKVNKLMIDQVRLDMIENPNLRRYMFRHLEIVTVVSVILLIRSGTDEHLKKKDELWDYIKNKDIKLYQDLKYGLMGRLINLPGRAGRRISVGAYKISQRLVGFN
ncbi:MAG: glycosyltransferase family 2 protein [Paenibacillus macerans]|uniref:Glycosyl transferase 2 family protein n=1 Tax=Paenibacillus macerans TaxID=44252 RepID=A0A090Z5V8_PAEMA|nr:glycosyltransferase family 2 protein [Paenibacillus macerans]KFN05753.1 glycosyl transferase 2 family protein [Paenibacillus macerans]MBS5910029.1 glycosyltransferase family 2 protein [Paenibacillus macerans]MCY7560172.1 glycosyltransferase family 2 protein [Paenibacillus macerans]MDU7475799.1 glycosyltransferase family 2 protein [Paenibacillus macerans]MEC0149643.1 glycosyltransferase family 2 protein [Paenibacillus macerans]